MEGEPNPEFQLAFKGLLDHDGDPVWLEEPQFVTDADENSPAGVYEVTVSAEPESYVMTFKSGKLTVKAKPIPNAISDIHADQAEAPAYNLQGQRVDALRKGLYIRNGKKIIK